MNTQHPTVGRIVNYYPTQKEQDANGGSTVLPAMIVAVEGGINLQVFTNSPYGLMFKKEVDQMVYSDGPESEIPYGTGTWDWPVIVTRTGGEVSPKAMLHVAGNDPGKKRFLREQLIIPI